MNYVEFQAMRKEAKGLPNLKPLDLQNQKLFDLIRAPLKRGESKYLDNNAAKRYIQAMWQALGDKHGYKFSKTPRLRNFLRDAGYFTGETGATAQDLYYFMRDLSKEADKLTKIRPTNVSDNIGLAFKKLKQQYMYDEPYRFFDVWKKKLNKDGLSTMHWLSDNVNHKAYAKLGDPVADFIASVESKPNPVTSFIKSVEANKSKL